MGAAEAGQPDLSGNDHSGAVRIRRPASGISAGVSPSGDVHVPASDLAGTPGAPDGRVRLLPRRVPEPLYKIIYRDAALEAEMGCDLAADMRLWEARAAIDYIRAASTMPSSVSVTHATSGVADPSFRLDWTLPSARGVSLARLAVMRLGVQTVAALTRALRRGDVSAIHPGAWVVVTGQCRASDDLKLVGLRGRSIRLGVGDPARFSGWPPTLERRPVFAFGRIDGGADLNLGAAIVSF